MSKPGKKDTLIATDGLLARPNGLWGKEKLSFLDEYMPPALIATQRIRERYYVDLFAGPGLNIDENTQQEFPGGIIRALKITDGRSPPRGFTHLVGVNLDHDDHVALTTRVNRIVQAGETIIPPANVLLQEGDANSHVSFIMRKIPKRSYVIVFADPDNPSQLPFSTIEALRADGHVSVDLYVLYPSAMALQRLLANPQANERVLNRFYGDEQWRSLADKRVTSAQFPELMRSTREHYLQKLRNLGWQFADVRKKVRRKGNAELYDMIFATNHPAGNRIGGWAGRDEQLGLL